MEKHSSSGDGKQQSDLRCTLKVRPQVGPGEFIDGMGVHEHGQGLGGIR